jgi:hypothetical protein
MYVDINKMTLQDLEDLLAVMTPKTREKFLKGAFNHIQGDSGRKNNEQR